MLSIQKIIQNKDTIITKLEERNVVRASEYIEKVIHLDNDRKKIQLELDNALHHSKEISREIGELFKAGKKEEANIKRQQTGEAKENIAKLNEQMKKHIKVLTHLLYELPNIHNDNVPVGFDAKNNTIIEEFGTRPNLDSNALPHWELIKKYDIIDFELGSKITGAGFPVYKKKGAQLQRALINFFLNEASEAGYEEIQPPILVNNESGIATGQLPDKEGQMYEITNDKLYLIPTGEIPITNIYRDVILKEEDLPIKNVGYTSCFRREAGSWGANVRGLNRLHQFDKVEIVQVTLPEHSYSTLEDMRQYIQSLLKKLELPVRVLNLCTGDLGFTSAQTYDMEVFSAAQKSWLEVSSVSNFEDYQSNRLKLRYKNEKGSTTLLHTLNGSALALPRIVASILENNQCNDGIKMPKVLLPYLSFDIID